MIYKNTINEAFELYDKIENEILKFQRISDEYIDIKYFDEKLIIATDSRTKNYEAEIIIRREEIYDKVLNENIEPQDAICSLLKNKICRSAHEQKQKE